MFEIQIRFLHCILYKKPKLEKSSLFLIYLLFYLVCGDYYWYDCIRIRNRNSCSSSQKQKCPRTCGVCTGRGSDPCTNLSNTQGDARCNEMASEGKCRDGNFRRRYRMKYECSKVCCELQELYSYSG